MKVINVYKKKEGSKDRSLRYSMCDSLLFWVKTKNRDKLFSATKIWDKPVIQVTSNTIMGKFINKDTMINSIEGFLEVNKNTTSIIALIKGVPDLFCDVYESMIGWIFWSKSKLQFVN